MAASAFASLVRSGQLALGFGLRSPIKAHMANVPMPLAPYRIWGVRGFFRKT